MMKKLCAWILLLAALCAASRAETFLVTSDLHLTADRAAHEPTLDALREAASGADAVLLLGDSTNNTHAGEHARVLEFLASLDVPAFIIPGNHDITPDLSEFIDRYAEYGWNRAFSRDADSASCAVLTAGGACLLLLDTNDTPGYVASQGGISGETCAWVKETLLALPEGTPVVACGHHPILPSERWARTPGAGSLVAALDGVKLYLCGHDHGFAAVKTEALQQITVGQPHAYPGWVGLLEVSPAGLRWRVLPLYDEPTRQAMRESALALARGMARGTLAGTAHADDETAIQWFAEAFEAAMTSELNDQTCAALLNAPGAQLWREIETRTVVKRWIFGLLHSHPQDVRKIDIAF